MVRRFLLINYQIQRFRTEKLRRKTYLCPPPQKKTLTISHKWYCHSPQQIMLHPLIKYKYLILACCMWNVKDAHLWYINFKCKSGGCLCIMVEAGMWSALSNQISLGTHQPAAFKNRKHHPLPPSRNTLLSKNSWWPFDMIVQSVGICHTVVSASHWVFCLQPNYSF